MKMAQGDILINLAMTVDFHTNLISLKNIYILIWRLIISTLSLFMCTKIINYQKKKNMLIEKKQPIGETEGPTNLQ